MGALERGLKRPAAYTGVWGWLVTVDHKRIGILYGVTAFSFFLLSGVQALVLRAQLASSEQSLVSPELFNQLFTMHALTMIFLVIMPLGAAFFNYLIPLQIGARDVAFPRLNALSYWIFLSGALVLNGGYIAGFTGSPNWGWFAYAPGTNSVFNPGHGMDFYVLGLLLLGVSSMAAGFNFIVTIINMRAPGMTLMRMPVFTWMTLITSFLLILAMPVITVALVELLFDRFFGAVFFAPEAGADPIMWQHLFWVFGHPEVYILILPAMGIASEVLPTFSRKPLFGYPVIIVSGIIIGFMGWTVWSHHMFTVGLGAVANSAFAISTMLIAIPTGVKIFNWIATLWNGSIDLRTPMLFSLAFIALFIVGGLSGVTHAASPSDAQQQDTYYIVAHLHYVLFGGSMFAIFSGVYYWFPKMTGKFLNERLGKLHFWSLFVGMNVTFAPMHWVGLDGMPRRVYTYSSDMGWDFWNFISTLGAFVIAAAIIIFIVNVYFSLRRGEISPSDPWDGRTLEWSIPSPPPEYNFAHIPVVQSRDDFWRQKYVETGDGQVKSVPAGVSDEHSDENGKHIHMPGLSYFPIVTAAGLLGAVVGLILREENAILGIAVLVPSVITALLGIYGWGFEPADPEE
ncbi:MAG: cytochrome c oxidase subunit I [SAR202 cluster bacterium Io17-Chloro-G3]|nr:MAG: cytochrome c oxidase subunit I [SAR202 cluster bacterium Io17-Chloro-G3]